MEDNDDMEIDPAIAEAMGFSGFGMQSGKKRKFNANDGFVDPQIAASRAQGKGANSTPLGEKASKSANKLPHRPKDMKEPPEKDKMEDFASPNPATWPDAERLRQLRNGVRNENGDMVYFMPSFLEDPWKDLMPK